eukprot:TRINITY_DN6023_c0_g1_i3.p1 TRINITY_DN6023_c0_g1~~TRINITY_DN6023_c0_g1_i3.p1  ORF type:complete len:1220 (+),score=222.35 TRINITY_DN6023_c0_g1_i3:27-3686(+)
MPHPPRGPTKDAALEFLESKLQKNGSSKALPTAASFGVPGAQSFYETRGAAYARSDAVFVPLRDSLRVSNSKAEGAVDPRKTSAQKTQERVKADAEARAHQLRKHDAQSVSTSVTPQGAPVEAQTATQFPVPGLDKPVGISLPSESQTLAKRAPPPPPQKPPPQIAPQQATSQPVQQAAQFVQSRQSSQNGQPSAAQTVQPGSALSSVVAVSTAPETSVAVAQVHHPVQSVHAVQTRPMQNAVSLQTAAHAELPAQPVQQLALGQSASAKSLVQTLMTQHERLVPPRPAQPPPHVGLAVPVDQSAASTGAMLQHAVPAQVAQAAKASTNSRRAPTVPKASLGLAPGQHGKLLASSLGAAGAAQPHLVAARARGAPAAAAGGPPPPVAASSEERRGNEGSRHGESAASSVGRASPNLSARSLGGRSLSGRSTLSAGSSNRSARPRGVLAAGPAASPLQSIRESTDAMVQARGSLRPLQRGKAPASCASASQVAGPSLGAAGSPSPAPSPKLPVRPLARSQTLPHNAGPGGLIAAGAMPAREASPAAASSSGPRLGLRSLSADVLRRTRRVSGGDSSSACGACAGASGAGRSGRSSSPPAPEQRSHPRSLGATSFAKANADRRVASPTLRPPTAPRSQASPPAPFPAVEEAADEEDCVGTGEFSEMVTVRCSRSSAVVSSEATGEEADGDEPVDAEHVAEIKEYDSDAPPSWAPYHRESVEAEGASRAPRRHYSQPQPEPEPVHERQEKHTDCLPKDQEQEWAQAHLLGDYLGSPERPREEEQRSRTDEKASSHGSPARSPSDSMANSTDRVLDALSPPPRRRFHRWESSLERYAESPEEEAAEDTQEVSSPQRPAHAAAAAPALAVTPSPSAVAAPKQPPPARAVQARVRQQRAEQPQPQQPQQREPPGTRRRQHLRLSRGPAPTAAALAAAAASVSGSPASASATRSGDNGAKLELDSPLSKAAGDAEEWWEVMSEARSRRSPSASARGPECSRDDGSDASCSYDDAAQSSDLEASARIPSQQHLVSRSRSQQPQARPRRKAALPQTALTRIKPVPRPQVRSQANLQRQQQVPQPQPQPKARSMSPPAAPISPNARGSLPQMPSSPQGFASPQPRRRSQSPPIAKSESPGANSVDVSAHRAEDAVGAVVAAETDTHAVAGGCDDSRSSGAADDWWRSLMQARELRCGASAGSGARPLVGMERSEERCRSAADASFDSDV